MTSDARYDLRFGEIVLVEPDRIEARTRPLKGTKGPKKTWKLTDEQLSRMRSFLADPTVAYATIGREFGVDGKTVRYHARKAGAPRRPQSRRKVTDAMAREGAVLLAAGAKKKDLAEAWGVTRTTVRIALARVSGRPVIEAGSSS